MAVATSALCFAVAGTLVPIITLCTDLSRLRRLMRVPSFILPTRTSTTRTEQDHEGRASRTL